MILRVVKTDNGGETVAGRSAAESTSFHIEIPAGIEGSRHAA